MPENRIQQDEHSNRSRFRAMLSATSKALTFLFIVSLLVIIIITVPLTTLAYSVDPRFAILPIVLCLILCCYLFSREQKVRDIIETSESAGSSFVESIIRKVVDKSIQNAFETLILFPVGVALFGVVLIVQGFTSVGTFAVVCSAVGLAVVVCCGVGSRFVASKGLELYLGSEQRSSESTPLMV